MSCHLPLETAGRVDQRKSWRVSLEQDRVLDKLRLRARRRMQACISFDKTFDYRVIRWYLQLPIIPNRISEAIYKLGPLGRGYLLISETRSLVKSYHLHRLALSLHPSSWKENKQGAFEPCHNRLRDVASTLKALFACWLTLRQQQQQQQPPQAVHHHPTHH
jgi:hypothetical protein